MRVGLHTGECDMIGGKPRGIAVHIGARVAAEARAGEVLNLAPNPSRISLQVLGDRWKTLVSMILRAFQIDGICTASYVRHRSPSR